MDFTGRLSAFSPAELLSWAGNDRRSGSLLLRRPDREARIFFHQGRVVGCLSDQAAEYFGQHLLLEGLIDQDTLLEVLTACQESRQRLGRALLERGILERQTVESALASQVEDLVLGVFLWKEGVFSFRADLPPEELRLPRPIDPMALVFEGARWIDEEKRIRRRLSSDRTRLRAGEGWPGQNLSPRQFRVSEGLKAGPALDELYGRVRGSWFRFLCAVDQLLELGIAEIQQKMDVGPEETRETTLYELLLEQASEEQRRDARSFVRFPVAILERLVPAWVEPPTEDDLRPMPVRARTFLESLDGDARLGDLLSDEEDLRREEIELLLLHLQDETLALLPAPSGELGRRGRSWWKRLKGR